LTKLDTLGMGMCKISDVTPLESLDSLINVYLDGNKIKDVSALEELSGLKELNLKDNPIKKDKIEELQEELPNCTIHFDE